MMYKDRYGHAPFFNFEMFAKNYTMPADYLISAQVNKVAGDTGTFAITFVDTMDLNLDDKFNKMIAQQKKLHAQFYYGYHDVSLESPKYKGFIRDYNPQFTSGGYMMITITGDMYSEYLEQECHPWKGDRISDILEEIYSKYKSKGWKLDGTIERTDLLSESNRVFQQNNVDIITFIRQTLLPQANVKGNPFTFTSRSLSDGFHIKFQRDNKNKNHVSREYTFEMFAGNYGSVISFSPNISGAALAPQFVESGNISGLDNTVSVYGDDSTASDDKRVSRVPQQGGEDSEFVNVLDNAWYKKNVGSYPAKLVIAGDPTIEPLDYIRVTPFRPDGTPHWSASKYQVIKVTDNIISGFYTTELELLRMPENLNNDASGRGIEAIQHI